MKLAQLDEFLHVLTHRGGHIDLEYNDHHSVYSTVKECEEDYGWPHNFWASEDERAVAIETNTLWEFHLRGTEKDFTVRASSLHACIRTAVSWSLGMVGKAIDVDEFASELETFVKSLLKGEHTNAYIRYNEHHMNELPAKDAVFLDFCGKLAGGDAVMEEIITQNRLCKFIWYPSTQVGCYSVVSSTLQRCVDYVEDMRHKGHYK